MCYYYTCKRFQPTLPARGATWGGQGICLIAKRFQPTLPARGATIAAAIDAGDNLISTHAPRTGSDKQSGATTAANGAFQPTLPARGATLSGWHCHDRRRHFNPRSPHGERRTAAAAAAQAWRISTHAPRTGSDSTAYAGCAIYGQFQPTLPARGATGSAAATRASCKISTHAPRTGSDLMSDAAERHRRNFNPRSPHGERHGTLPRLI